MATESVYLRFNGFLANGQTSNASTLPYARTLKRVRMNIVGIPPTTDLTIQAVIGGVVQDQVFTWPAGAPSVDIPVDGDGLAITANISLAFQVVDAAGVADLDIEAVCESATAEVAGDDVDCGLGMLSAVKAHVLAAPLQARTEYDTALTAIAKGVVGMLESFLNRKLARIVNFTEDFSADRDHWYCAHAPLESIAQLELDYAGGSGYQVVTGLILQTAANGKVQFAGILGSHMMRARLTGTGGYWYDNSTDQSGSLPTGATAMPDAITLAWLTQIEHLWNNRDTLGIGITSGGERRFEKSRLQTVELLPVVKELLQPFRRYQLT